ncbi:DUF2764 family protein [Roseimarinus sediminis]|jgi:hypothetical protein|uniref:DUF2764 family protein n=1 Tax=Roseimarinus sediminis TaxID=1610899 RepID=UPI003D1D22A0
MGNYYYLISGLPELQLDDQKLKLSLIDFKRELEENLSESDLNVLSYFFMQFDNENLLKYLNDREATLDPLGNLNREDFEEMLLLFRESDQPRHPRIYEYFKYFVPVYLSDTAIFEGMRREDELTSLYYDFALGCKNDFIAEWFRFNLNISNILSALNCLKYNIDRETVIVGTDEISEALRNSNARDFGIAAEFPEVDEIVRIAEESDLYERERKIDLLKWNWLEEKGFFHYFDVEHLFIYLVRLQLLSRWVQLERESGLKVFRDMIEQLQHAFEFPNEFTVQKVAAH